MTLITGSVASLLNPEEPIREEPFAFLSRRIRHGLLVVQRTLPYGDDPLGRRKPRVGNVLAPN